MTIGIDVSRANKEQKTGVETYAYFLVEEMKKITENRIILHIDNQDVKVILYSREPLIGQLGILPDGWESRVLRWPPKRLWTQLRLSFEMLVRPPDVLFVPAHTVPLIHPKKTVMTVHDIAAIKFPGIYNRFERWYTIWSARYAAKKLWRVIVPSRCTKFEMEKMFGNNSQSRTHVIPLGYDVRYQKIHDAKRIDAVLKKYHIRKPFLLSVGRLEEKKNTRRIIEAFEKIRLHNFHSAISSESGQARDHQLVLAGMPGYGYESIAEAIKRSPCRSDIIELGWIPTEDIAAVMNAADALIFSSLYEGFGMPILEAFACGTPVITSYGTSTEEVGGSAATYVNPEDADDIAQGIARLLSDSELRQALVDKGLRRVRDFSWKKCAVETWRVLIGER